MSKTGKIVLWAIVAVILAAVMFWGIIGGSAIRGFFGNIANTITAVSYTHLMRRVFFVGYGVHYLALRDGSCAMLRCEPCQVLTEAAVSKLQRVPQVRLF